MFAHTLEMSRATYDLPRLQYGREYDNDFCLLARMYEARLPPSRRAESALLYLPMELKIGLLFSLADADAKCRKCYSANGWLQFERNIG